MSIDAQSIYVQVPFARLEALLDRLLAERLQPEIGFSGPDLDQLAPGRLDAIGGRLADAGLSLTVHAPYNDLNPGALDPLVAAITARRIRQSIECAARLDARLMVIHPGYDPWRYGFHEQLWLEKTLAFWPPLLELADRHQLPLALENVFDRRPRPLGCLLEELAAPGLGFCLDVGHLQLFRGAGLEEWLESLAPYLVHLHLHDNNGDRDAHLPLGEGSFDFARLFSLLRRHRLAPSATLENPGLEDALSSRRALQSYL